ncbi:MULTISPECIES: ATP-binding protein [unclassified Duganella]|uniref:AAA family ATPase n=1 Tax=unclassified Duganella TaxID=2636909 RepID=UPI000E34C331|nr:MULTISPECIES: ATP-binding protein [unclassified Duganella]RFP16052.1 ATP-binding protein [Duganella sp. BJB475]RFP32784.1 ATP-binding protein [Duganella sp. BJB476]
MKTEVQVPAVARVATLHLVCGKIAAGKSTLMSELSKAPNTVLISEDKMLATLYPGEIQSLADYVRCTTKLRSALQGLIRGVLAAGSSVVLDFPANTIATRSWMKTLFADTPAAHCLHYLDVSDEECKRRLRRRNEEGLHQFSTSEAEFDLITQFFAPPTEAEGFNVKRS